MRLKSRKAELKERIKVNLENSVGMFCHDCRYNIRFIFTDTKPGNFRFSKKQSTPNTPLRCLNFSFPIDGLTDLNCSQRRVGKSQ